MPHKNNLQAQVESSDWAFLRLSLSACCDLNLNRHLHAFGEHNAYHSTEVLLSVSVVACGDAHTHVANIK